jgi:hypothetical protein
MHVPAHRRRKPTRAAAFDFGYGNSRRAEERGGRLHAGRAKGREGLPCLSVRKPQTNVAGKFALCARIS